MKTPMKYLGSKSRAIKYILPLIPKNTEVVISPFIGGGAVEVALASRGIKVIGYDVFNWLTNYWYWQIKSPKELSDVLRKFEYTKEYYCKHKMVLKDKFFSNYIPTTIQDAADYWYSHNMSYGPIFLGWWGTKHSKPTIYLYEINKVSEFKTDKLFVRTADFKESIKTNQGRFLFLDPPYMMTEGDNKLYKYIYPSPDFPIHHKGFDHVALRDLLKSHQGGFVMTYNDVPEIRKLYEGLGFQFFTPEWRYSAANGKPSNELIIYCPAKDDWMEE